MLVDHEVPFQDSVHNAQAGEGLFPPVAIAELLPPDPPKKFLPFIIAVVALQDVPLYVSVQKLAPKITAAF